MAEDISSSVAWRLQKAIAGTIKGDVPQSGTARVQRRDSDGTVWLRLPGSSVDTPVTGAVVASVSAGDVVSYSISGGKVAISGNATQPSVGEKVVQRIVKPVRKIAQEAKGIAEATGQYFWHDDNGAHISTEKGNPAGVRNAVWNSLGMLFRAGMTNLLAIVAGEDSGVDVYDGQGNEDENTVASLRGSRVRVGYEDGAHVAISPDGIDGTNKDGMEVMRVSSDAGTGESFMEKRIGEVVTWASSQTDTHAITFDGVNIYPIATGSAIEVSVDCDITMSSSSTVQITQLVSFTQGTAASQTLLSGTGMDIGITVAYDGDTGFTVTSAPLSSSSVSECDATISRVAYETDVMTMPAFTFGTRAGDAQGYSYVMGEGIETAREHQAVFGRYNSPSATDLLQIGNGTITNRSNVFSVDEDGNLYASGRLLGNTNKRLWSGGYYMDAGHTATLSEHVRDQPNGIVLVWSAYVNGAAQNYDWNFTYIPKGWILNYNGNGLSCVMARAGLAAIAVKYVTIVEPLVSGSTTIKGDSRNVGSGTASGISYNNSAFVLREVWGV